MNLPVFPLILGFAGLSWKPPLVTLNQKFPIWLHNLASCVLQNAFSRQDFPFTTATLTGSGRLSFQGSEDGSRPKSKGDRVDQTKTVPPSVFLKGKTPWSSSFLKWWLRNRTDGLLNAIQALSQLELWTDGPQPDLNRCLRRRCPPQTWGHVVGLLLKVTSPTKRYPDGLLEQLVTSVIMVIYELCLGFIMVVYQ